MLDNVVKTGITIGMTCKKGYDIQILHSANGYYKGTLDEKKYHHCRLSSRYVDTIEEAKKLPMNLQHSLENVYCNNCNCWQ